MNHQLRTDGGWGDGSSPAKEVPAALEGFEEDGDGVAAGSDGGGEEAPGAAPAETCEMAALAEKNERRKNKEKGIGEG